MIPSLYGMPYHDGKTHAFQKPFMADNDGHLVGQPSFRQLRVKNGTGLLK